MSIEVLVKELVQTQEAAATIERGVGMVYHLEKTGRLPCIRLGAGRDRLFLRSDLLKLRDELRAERARRAARKAAKAARKASSRKGTAK
jgi:hypothetical protein